MMLRRHFTNWARLAALASCVAAAALSSQTVRSEPTAAVVASLLRTQAHAGAALSVLRQAHGAVPKQSLDEIADSLVAIAATFPGMDLRGVQTRNAALTTLLLAGRGGVDDAVPYAGAVERLMRIAQTAQDAGIQASALRGLTQLQETRPLLSFLERVAQSDNVVAWVAVTMLTEETGAAGKAVARALYRDGASRKGLREKCLIAPHPDTGGGPDDH